MKRLTISVLCAILGMTACNGGVREKKQSAPSKVRKVIAPLVFDIINVNDSLLPEEGGGCAVFDRTVAFPIEGDAEQLTWIRQWIALALSGKNDTLAATPKHTAALFAQAHLAVDFNRPKSIGELGKDAFFEQYRVDEDYSTSTLYYGDFSNLQVVWQTPTILSFSHNTENFSGGAHGNMKLYYTCFDLTTNRQLLFRDIFLPEKRNEILQFFEKQLCAHFEVASADELPLTKGMITFPDNTPCLLPKGIMFQYQQYEIAAYAYGMPEVFIPYAEIWHCLTPHVQTLLGEAVKAKKQ